MRDWNVSSDEGVVVSVFGNLLIHDIAFYGWLKKGATKMASKGGFQPPTLCPAPDLLTCGVLELLRV